MGVLLFLIPLAVLIALLGVIGVFWSIRNNQFDDLKSQSEKILYDKNSEQNK